MAKLLLSIMLIFMLFGLVSPGESPYPEIKDFTYKIEYRYFFNSTIKTIYVDFTWTAKIKGKYDKQKVIFNIIFKNAKDEEIHKVTEVLTINPKEIQSFEGKQMLLSKVASEVERGGKVVVDLGIVKKKY